MNRRRFPQQSGRALAAAPLFSSPLGSTSFADANPAMQGIPAAALNRIGITTVCFRERFPATRTRGAAAPPGGDLTLLTAPKFIADQLGIHNVEIWSAQFAEMSLDYCKQIKAAAAAAGSQIINVQVDGPENLSDPDATKRAAAIASIKQWMDRSAAVGAPRMRANTGSTSAPTWDVNQTADSFRQLAEYGKTIGVKILIENHDGSSNPDRVVQVVKAVNHPNCRVLCDWGNSELTDQLAGLTKLFPNLELVSAKELDFDDQNRHISYDIVPIIKATEASGFRGIYSIEFYSDHPPNDVVAAAKDMMRTIAANLARP
jgi:sugar phosphate isomerase/epimerase